MTPPVPTSADRTRIASKRRQTTQLIVNAVPLNPVASARVNDADITYPLADLSVDSVSSDWQTEGLAGRRFGIGTAANLMDIATGVLRFNNGASTAFIDPRYAGDGGWKLADIAQLIEDDHYITIFDDYPPYGVQSSIRGGKFYKFWSQQFTNAAKDPTPVQRLGAYPRVDAINGVGTVTITADTFHFPGRSYFGHAWEAPTGTITASDASSATIAFPEGCHEVRRIETDTRGRSSVAVRKVFVNGPTYRPLCGTVNGVPGRYRLVSADCQQDRVGCTITLILRGQFSPTDFYPGQLFALHEINTYAGGETLDEPDATAWQYVAYLGDAGLSTTPDGREVTLTLYSPMTMAEKIVVPRQTMIEKTSPKNWAEITPVLSNPVGYAWYLIALHAPYLLRNHDFTFDPDMLNLRRQAAEFSHSDALGAHLKQLSAWLNGPGVIGSRTDGTTRMLRHPNYMDTDERNNLPVQWTYREGHIRQRLEHRYRWWPQTGRTTIGGFASAGGSKVRAHKAVAPGFLNSQAPGETSHEDTIVPFNGNQTVERIKALAGYLHAHNNARTEIEPTLLDRNLDVAQPVDLDRLYIFDIPATYDPTGTGWVNERRWPLSVQRTWTPEGKTVTPTWEPETFGYPGQEVPKNAGAGKIWVSQRVPDGVQPYKPLMPELGVTIPVMTAWNNFLLYGRSSIDDPARAFATQQAMFRRVPDAVRVVSADLNLDSPYFDDPSDPLEQGLLTYDNDAGALTVHSLDDLFAEEPTITALETVINVNDHNSEGFRLHAHLLIDPENGDFWVLAYKNFGGVHIYRSADGGATWDSGVRIGATDPVNIGDETNLDTALAIAVRDGVILVVAHEGDTDVDGHFVYNVWKATDMGSFSKIANPDAVTMAYNGSIVFTGASNAVVSMIRYEAPEPDNALEPVTFDSGGYPDYSLSGGSSSDGIGTFLGFGSQANMAYGFTASGFGTSVFLNLTVNLTAFYTLSSVTFLRAFSNSASSPVNRRWHYTVSALDAEGNILGQYSTEDEPSTDFTNPDTITVTADQMGLSPADWVWSVTISITDEWDSDSGSSGNYVMIDDIDVDATLVDFDTDRALYTLNPGTGAYTRRNSFQLLPSHRFGLAYGGSNLVLAIAEDEDGNDPWLLRSTNGGQTWAKVRRADGFHGLKCRANVVIDGEFRDVTILFGDNRLHLSVNGGLSSYDASGDWVASVGPLGRIEGISGVL